MRILVGCVFGFLALVAQAAAQPLFLADDARHPHVVISWPTKGGGRTTLEADREYRSPGEKTPLGKNLECFVALGGTRLDKGFGHPAGAIVRVGFYKADFKKPLFDEIAEDARIRVRLTGVHFNRPGTPRPETALQHLKYMKEDLEACGLGLQAMDQFNTASETDTMGGKIQPQNARMGILDGREGGGFVRVRAEEDGSISMEAEFPYRLLRHVRDPWLRETPGSFFEPNHFHIEFEVLPEDVARAEAEAKARAEAEAAAAAAERAAQGEGEPGGAAPAPDAKAKERPDSRPD